MKLDIVANSQNDEFYTPEYAVEPLLKFLKPSSLIWCPFDLDCSNFVKLLTEAGHKVIATHIFNKENFFELEPPANCDYIISNPPYSMKTEVLERLFSFKVPFAMLLGIVGIFESQKRFTLFKNNTFEILYLNKRIAYFKNYNEQIPSLNPPFSSAYICSNVLPHQICFEYVEK